jgi:2-polyprenyl-3-methyl-5-hydroxy-6-metoxy-1,4-benzoquinol methylase
VTDSYETLAVDYDWIFDDHALANGAAINRPATARLLQRISRTSAVLDAACGTGVNAAALARRGFTVWAADASHIAHLVFVFENGDQTEAHEYELTFRPFTIAELRKRLELAGLREVDTDFDDSGDRYAVVTRAT